MRGLPTPPFAKHPPTDDNARVSATILFAGGGSGGHLYPGVSVAEVLTRMMPGLRPLFLCTKREIDSTILKSTPFEFIQQPIVPPRKSVGGLINFWRGWRSTQDLVRSIIKERAPAAVLGLGGYAAGVTVKLAGKAKIPAAILNPDVIPGKANQFLFNSVQKVCCQFEATAKFVSEQHQSKLIVTGCPIRSDIASRPNRTKASMELGLDPSLHTLVVTGASQGAVTVNQAILETLTRIHASGRSLQGWQVLHLAGKDNADEVKAEYRELEMPAVVLDFTPAMSDVWAVADLAVARAGASTCAELAVCGVPSVLMPYPFHKDQHQLANAKVLADAGASVVVSDERDRKKSGDALTPIIEGLLYDVPQRKAMSDAAFTLAKPDAAERVANVLREMMAGQ